MEIETNVLRGFVEGRVQQRADIFSPYLGDSPDAKVSESLIGTFVKSKLFLKFYSSRL